MSLYLSNAFSLQMLDLSKLTGIVVKPISLEEVKSSLEFEQGNFISAVGHQDTANILSNMLGYKVPYNRINIKLQENDTLIVAQVVGGRLPEGATTLPEGTKIEFVSVQIFSDE